MNAVYTEKNLKSLGSTVNQDLCKLFDWLTANKLTLNLKKQILSFLEIMIFDNVKIRIWL